MILTSCKDKPVVDKSNPFFSEFNTPFGVPPFEKIMAKHYMPAFDTGIVWGRKEIEVAEKEMPEPTALVVGAIIAKPTASVVGLIQNRGSSDF